MTIEQKKSVVSLSISAAQKQAGTSLDHVARWVPEEQKADYWRMMAHFKTLTAEDEILRLADAMGVLTTLTRQVPGELASERIKFREEHIQIDSEIRKLLEAAIAQTLTVSQALRQINATAQTTLQAVEKATDVLKNAADRVDVKSIGDRLAREVQEKSIHPVSQLNEKLLMTERQFSDLAVKTHIMMDLLKQARWWVPWIAAFSICGALFTFAWHSYQTSIDSARLENSTEIRSRSR